MFIDWMVLLVALKPTFAGLIGTVVVTLHLIAVVALLAGRGSAAHKATWSFLMLLLPLAGVMLYLARGKSQSDRSLLD